MLPPKKNQAAREEQKDREEAEENLSETKPEENNEDTKEEKEKGDKKSKTEGSKVMVKGFVEIESDDEDFHKNIFEKTNIDGKRKHFVNRHDTVFEAWVNKHFEEREGKRCALSQCYEIYLNHCTAENINNAFEEFKFNKVVKKKFPNGFGLRETSDLKDDIREYKYEYKKGGVKADTLKLKIKDVIHQAFDELNNPKEGVMFNSLKKFMIGKFPALQLDEKPKVLLNNLQSGVYHGYIEQIRGIGRAGKYRWYDPKFDEESEDEETPEKKAKKEEDGETKEGEDGAEEGDENEEGKEGETSDEKDNEKATPKKKSHKTKDNPKPKRRYRKRYIVHSNPQRIDEAFPLAFTFMAEPKETSGRKCLNYIEKFYDVETTPEKLMKVFEKGADKGYWTAERGNGINTVYQLTVETFDPSDDDDMIGKVINAIMASTEPKLCSAIILKNYLTEFHPNWKIDKKPYLFKKALQRAIDRDVLKQLSGIGATGTFQLVEPFVASPAILAGKDTQEDYEQPDTSEDEDSEGDINDLVEVDISQFQDAYKPRPSQRRGKTREVTKTGGFDKNAIYVEALIQHKKSIQHRKSGSGRKAGPGRKPGLKVPSKQARNRIESSSEEEEEDSDKEEEADSSADEVDSTYGSDSEKYKPRPSQSRGGGGQARGRPPTKASKKMRPEPPKKGKAKKRSRTPTPPPPKPAAKGRKPPTKRDETPSPSKAAAKKTPARKSPAKRRR